MDHQILDRHGNAMLAHAKEAADIDDRMADLGPAQLCCGETSKSELRGASREMYDSMTENELEELASTEHKGLPEHKA